MTGLAGSAVGAGMINAVAGGGTLLTFPTLLAFGTSPVMANATSTLALVIGTSGGMFGNRQYIKPVLPWLKRFLPVSLLGGLIGSALLTHNPSGFWWSLAILASSLFDAMPMVAVNWRSDRIRCFSCWASGRAFCSDACIVSAWQMPDMSRYASSTDICSTIAPVLAMISMIR